MSLNFPSGGMFGIKLVGHEAPQLPFYGRDANPPLMNFPDSLVGRRLAEGIPVGHRSLVYLMAPAKRFWTAIEYIKGDLEDGMRAAVAQGAFAFMEVYNSHFARIWRCVRILAQIDDPKDAPTPEFGFREGEIMRYITEQEFNSYFNDIDWSWRSP